METHSCNNCEWHAGTNGVHVCGEGIPVTVDLFNGTQECSKWETLDVERRIARDAEVARQVVQPEQKSRYQLMEEAMLADIARNPERWQRGFLSGYPRILEHSTVHRRREAIPYPSRLSREMDRHRVVPTLQDLQRVQSELPDPNTYSDSSIVVELAIDEIGHYPRRRIPLQFTKSEFYSHGQSFCQWAYHGHVMMTNQNNMEIEEDLIRQREQELRDEMYRRYRGIRMPGFTPPNS